MMLPEAGHAGLVADLVILDLSLPGISGVEVVEKLREAGILPEVALIIASRIANPASDIVEELHATAFLAKPFSIDFSIDFSIETMSSTVRGALSGPAQ